MKGGKFYQGDYGCVVYPGLTPNSESAVTKVFKESIEKRKEERVNDILKSFPNDFIVKKIEGPVDPSKNPEINMCRVGPDNHPITLKEIQANSISYEYLGKSYEEITQAELNEAFKALLTLTLKVIDMNSKGFTHNDIAPRNITFKDGRAYLIDIGAFEFKKGTQNYLDVSVLLNILVLIASRDNLLSGEDYQYLRGVSSSPLNPRTIESVKEVLNSLFIQGAKAPMLHAIQSAAGSKKYSRGNKAVAAKVAALVSSENRKSGQGPTAKARRRRGKKVGKSHRRRR
jgi:tRNA A-37 threonylcarbamoyl transferase component Bud32